MKPSPFKFLDSYAPQDIGSFFGRDRETGELFRQCFVSPILVVYGGSGTGKTSLVQCGLASRFQESDWLPVPVRRSGDMLSSLREEIKAHSLTPSASDDIGELTANLYLDHFKPVYFLFDQFEELFIFGGREENEAFFQAINALLGAERNVHVVFIIREEYLAELTRYEHSVPKLIENRYRVERMARSYATDVVERLCATNGIACTTGFSTAMVDRLNPEGQGVELSYLQVYLDRCWRMRKDDEPFSIALLERIGYVDDLLGTFLEEQVAETPDPEHAENLLKTFVSDQGTKRQLTAAEAHDWVNVIGTAMDLDEVERLLQLFVSKRLLRDRDERGRYELLHDALARQIFQRITRAEQELIEVRQFVLQAFGQFEKRGVRITANDLAYLRPYRNQLYLKGKVAEFVEGAFGEEERKQKRRKRRRRLMVVTLSLVVVGLAFMTYSAVQLLKASARTNMSNTFILLSKGMLGAGDPFHAFGAAQRAYELDPSIEAERAVLLAYNSMYPGLVTDLGTIARASDDRRSFLVIDAERGFNVYDMGGRLLFHKVLSSHQPNGVQYITGGTHILCVDSAVSIYNLQGQTIFTCDTSQWMGYNSDQRFVGFMRDSLLIENEGRIQRIGWKNASLLLNSVTKTKTFPAKVGFLDSFTVYLCGADSLRLVSLGTRPPISFSIAYPRPMPYFRVQAVKGKLACRIQGHGTIAFDPVLRRWSVLRLEGNGPMVWTNFFNDCVILQVGQDKDCFMELHRLSTTGSKPVRMSGWFLQHFPVTGTTLATTSGNENSETILYGPEGQILLRTKGYPASFDDQGFVVVSDSTVTLDRVSIWNAKGQLNSTIAVKKISAMSDPPVHAIWLDHVNDTAVVGYLSDAVINDQPVKEFRAIREDRTICYMTLPRDIQYRHRTMFHTLANGSSLVSRGQFGQTLVGSYYGSKRVPYQRNYVFYSAQAFRPLGFVQLDQMGSSGFRVPDDSATAYRSLAGLIWRPDSTWTVSFTKEGRNALTLNYYLGARNISPLGDRFKLVYSNKGFDGKQHVSMWNTTTGVELDNYWLRAAEDVLWSEQDTATALVIGKDSLYIMDRGLSRCLLAVDRDSSIMASGPDDRFPVFWNRHKSTLRIIDMGLVRVYEMHIAPDQFDARIDQGLGTYPDHCTISAQNDSTIYFVLNYWAGGGVVQRFVNGNADDAIETPGECRMVYRKDKAYLRSTSVTVKDGDYGIQKDRVDRVVYYHFVKEASGRRIGQSPMKVVERLELEFNILGDRIRHWEEDLLVVKGTLVDAHLPQRVLSTHRMMNEFEEFPMSAKEAIRMVRQDMVYGKECLPWINSDRGELGEMWFLK